MVEHKPCHKMGLQTILRDVETAPELFELCLFQYLFTVDEPIGCRPPQPRSCQAALVPQKEWADGIAAGSNQSQNPKSEGFRAWLVYLDNKMLTS